MLLLKAAVWLLGLYPLGRVAWWLRDGLLGLGANPIEKVLHHTGWWALTLLMVTLAVTPLRRITGRNELIRLRRPLGLFAFFYATLHVATYVVLDLFFAWDLILADILKRPFITAGMVAFVTMVPLALTSTRGWIRRLGRRWQLLHRLVYVSAIAAAIHYLWKVKVVIGSPVYYAAIVAGLLLFRLAWALRARRRSALQAADT